MRIREWIRCFSRGEHKWKQPVLRTAHRGDKYVIKVCRDCGRTKKQQVW